MPAEPHELREIPELFGQSLIGWATLPERLQRDHRDLTIADILRIQHLMGQKPHESGRARRTIRRGIRVDRAAFDGRAAARHRGRPRPRGAGRIRGAAGRVARRAEYEPFGAHSHYGLILGEESYQQVADAIRAFLEANRL